MRHKRKPNEKDIRKIYILDRDGMSFSEEHTRLIVEEVHKKFPGIPITISGPSLNVPGILLNKGLTNQDVIVIVNENRRDIDFFSGKDVGALRLELEYANEKTAWEVATSLLQSLSQKTEVT